MVSSVSVVAPVPARSSNRGVALLETLRSELLETRRTIVHYARLATQLELQLEQVQAEQQRAYRRAGELAAAIEREEGRQRIMQLPDGTRVQVPRWRRYPSRDDEIVEHLRRHGATVASQLAEWLHTSPNYASKLLADMARRGRIQRIAPGLYRAVVDG